MRSGPRPGFVAGSQGAGAAMTAHRAPHEVHQDSDARHRAEQDAVGAIRLEARFDESPRSIAWNRLWYKMLSEVLEAQRGTRPPDG